MSKSEKSASAQAHPKLITELVVRVESELLAIKPKRTAHAQEHYVGAGVSTYRFLNLSMPQVREFADAALDVIEDRPVAVSDWLIWDSIWNHTQIYDLLLAAVIWAGEQSVDELWQNKKILIRWAHKADNWALADCLCSIYAQLFESHPQEMKMTLEKWSRSRNPWERRMSNVSLFYYSRSRKKLPSYKFAETLILRQLADEHYYVQKGVGWALRECWNVYPKQTLALLKRIAHQIPPAAWTAATEKLSLKDKKALTSLRTSRRTRRISK